MQRRGFSDAFVVAFLNEERISPQEAIRLIESLYNLPINNILIYKNILKLRREFILGAVGVITLLLFVWGFNYLKGKDLLKKQQRFYVVYPVIDGLIESHPVTVNGVAIGQVNRIGFHKDRSGRVVVECLIGDYIDIPSNSIALLKSSSLIGGFEIELLLGNTPDYLQHGDTLTRKDQTSHTG
jgi:ABC-type transporter Mla subunit MlaD